jgi:hypothetical protein
MLPILLCDSSEDRMPLDFGFIFSVKGIYFVNIVIVAVIVVIIIFAFCFEYAHRIKTVTN